MIRENSTLDILNLKPENTAGSSRIKLWLGKLKAKVTKQNADGGFEVETPSIIAAVKGTEFIVGTSLNDSEVMVLEGLVAVYDLLREKELLIKENEKAGFRDGLFNKPGDMSPDEQKNLRNMFDTGSLRQHSIGNDRAELTKEIRELRSELLDIKDRSSLEDKQDLLERISDVQMGKSAVDMNGYRVRTDNYVLRPQPNTIMFLNLTKREDGPNKGITSLEISDKFNKDLPSSFMDVKRRLYNEDWFNETKPEFWL
jgi:hypothetical protein